MQINTNSIFNLDNSLGKLEQNDRYLSIHLIETNGAIIGTPMTITEKTLETLDTRGSLNAVSPFVFKKSILTNYLLSLRKNQFAVKGDSYINNHTIKEVNAFNIETIEDIQKYINDYDSISFVIKDKEQAAGCMFKFPKLLEKYKYNTSFNLESKGSSKDFIDITIPIFTFINLKHCIPIFNSKHVDGMVICIQALLEDYTEKAGTPTNLLQIVLVVSNYLDNVFVVDGEQINDFEYINKHTYETMAYALLAHHPKFGKDESKGVRAKKKSEQKKYKENTYRTYTFTSTTSNSSTSSGNNWCNTFDDDF